MKKGARKKVKKNVQSGIAHIQSTFNNTIITITDVAGNALVGFQVHLDSGLLADPVRGGPPDPVDIGQRDLDALVSR